MATCSFFFGYMTSQLGYDQVRRKKAIKRSEKRASNNLLLARF